MLAVEYDIDDDDGDKEAKGHEDKNGDEVSCYGGS